MNEPDPARYGLAVIPEMVQALRTPDPLPGSKDANKDTSFTIIHCDDQSYAEVSNGTDTLILVE